ncbi:hypothetical protein TWF730_002600 [Orbilia blumenaviensis]|uniref:F-box domain-containing protein n=1 Tax=Orbilia blumenaviensis TaxID=1796055 RepID=A0AAV9UBY8_9PEZI
MAIPGIPGPLLPIKLKYKASNFVQNCLRKVQQEQRTDIGDDDNSNASRWRGRFDMGQYLRLTSPINLSMPQDFTINIKSRFKYFMQNKLSKLAALRSRPTASRNTAGGCAEEGIIRPSIPTFSPFTALPPSIMLKVLQQLPPASLPSLLQVNKATRALILENYHLVLSYPHIITSKYEFYPLKLPFPDWWTHNSDRSSHLCQFFNAWWRVKMYEDCYIVLAEVLADEYIGYWKTMAESNPRLREVYEEVESIGWDGFKRLMLLELAKESFDRGVDGNAAQYLEDLVADGSLKRHHRKVQITKQGKEKAVEGYNWDQDSVFRGFRGDTGTNAAKLAISLTTSNIDISVILKQSLTFAIHKTVLEEVNYSFPTVKLRKLHPVQLLELLRVRVPPWSWVQENQIEQLKRVFVMSSQSREDIGRYRSEWGDMRDVVEGVLRAGVI